MSQQSDMAEAVYRRLNAGPIATAHIVQELRSRWGVEHGVGSVHNFVREVAACLLDHDDVEAGDLRDGTFIPWQLAAWDAQERINGELMPMDVFLDDETRCVFRKRQLG